MDYVHRKLSCKHIFSTVYSLKIRQKVTEQNLNLGGKNTVELLQGQVCAKCGSSEVVKDGTRRTKKGAVQRFSCKLCHFRFIPDNAFVRVKSTPEAILASLDLYFKGCSLHDIKDHLAQFYKVKVSHVCVLKWIRKYSALMKSYTDTLTPNTSSIWHTDEMMVHVRKTEPIKVGRAGEEKNLSWLWNLMDHDTRFLLASQIHKKREVQDARRVFAEAKQTSKTMPIAVVHDGLTSYDDAFNKEFYTPNNPKIINIRSIGSGKEGANPIVERLNGTVREREKVMRGMNTDESAQTLLDGNRLFYNFIRPHMALDGRTPAQAAGLNLGLGENRWSALVNLAHISRKLQAKPEGEESP